MIPSSLHNWLRSKNKFSSINLITPCLYGKWKVTFNHLPQLTLPSQFYIIIHSNLEISYLASSKILKQSTHRNIQFSILIENFHSFVTSKAKYESVSINFNNTEWYIYYLRTAVQILSDKQRIHSYNFLINRTTRNFGCICLWKTKRSEWMFIRCGRNFQIQTTINSEGSAIFTQIHL